ALAVGGEVGARGASLAGRHQDRGAGTVRRQPEDLVAGIGRMGGLEDELAAASELEEIRQMDLLRVEGRLLQDLARLLSGGQSGGQACREEGGEQERG